MKNLSKTQKLISFILFIILLIAFIIVGNREYKRAEEDEHKVFSQEYKEVPHDNVFVYANSSKIYNILQKKEDAIIFLGFKQNDFTGYYAKIINEVAKEVGIKEILYYDFYNDRVNNNGTYESIVLKLESYLFKNDLGKMDLIAPSIIVIKNENIIYYDDETAYIKGNNTPKDYWTVYNVGLKKATLTYIFNEFMEDINGK